MLIDRSKEANVQDAESRIRFTFRPSYRSSIDPPCEPWPSLAHVLSVVLTPISILLSYAQAVVYTRSCAEGKGTSSRDREIESSSLGSTTALALRQDPELGDQNEGCSLSCFTEGDTGTAHVTDPSRRRT